MTMMPTYYRRGTGLRPKPEKKPIAPSPNAAVQERILDSFSRVIRKRIIAVGRTWESCGKAACKRSHRCRGEACNGTDEA